MIPTPRMVYADASGEIFDHDKLRMAVFDGSRIREPLPEELIPLPSGSDFYLLPDRLPLGLSGPRKHLVELEGPVTAVSAFIAPAYLRLAHPAYRTMPEAKVLPLFAYAPVGWANGTFWTTALRIDEEPRQNPDLFDIAAISRGVERDLKRMPRNRLLIQLRRCALDYECRAAQNFFLKRWEAPLPTSQACNSQCLGCISHQEGEIPVTQERLTVSPSGAEVAEVALLHAGRVQNPIVSFGQGCEGEPLTRAKILVDAVKRIRAENAEVTINLNTNASKPAVVRQLFEAGLDSIRVSLASPVSSYYDLYHRPTGYTYDDVLESMRIAREMDRFISLNLLVFPGFTDGVEQTEALCSLVENYRVDMIQWRNLNIDSEYYLETMGREDTGPGLLNMVSTIKEKYPELRHGYFNPYISKQE